MIYWLNIDWTWRFLIPKVYFDNLFFVFDLLGQFYKIMFDFFDNEVYVDLYLNQFIKLYKKICNVTFSDSSRSIKLVLASSDIVQE